MIPKLPGPECATSNIACDAELILIILRRWNVNLELVERNCVANLETGVVPSPTSLIAAIQQTVGQEGKVSAGDTLSTDLLELSLLDQVTARSDEFPIAKSGLELQHSLEFVLK